MVIWLTQSSEKITPVSYTHLAETETVNAGDNGDLNVEDAVSAKIKGTDADNDLAVVAVKKSDIPEDTLNQIKIAQIGSSDDLAVGQQVVAIGNALGYGQSVTSVSYTHLYLHKASLLQDMSAVTAACLLMKKEVFEQAGGFTEEPVSYTHLDVYKRQALSAKRRGNGRCETVLSG